MSHLFSKLLLCSVVALCAATAHGEETPDGWSGTLSLSSNTSFERKSAIEATNAEWDLSDFEAEVGFEYDRIDNLPKIAFGVGGEYSPFAFDGTERESSLTASVTIGDTYLRPSVFRGSIRRAGDYENAVAASLSFEHSEDYEGFYRVHTGDTETVSGAVEYRRLEHVFCRAAIESGRVPPKGACGATEPSGALGYAIGLHADRVWATDPLDENKALGASIKLLVPGVFPRVTPSLSVHADRLWYDEPSSDGLPDRRDWQYGVKGGLDFTNILPTKNWLSVEAGVKHNWLDSNDPAKEARNFAAFVKLGVELDFLGGD